VCQNTNTVAHSNNEQLDSGVHLSLSVGVSHRYEPQILHRRVYLLRQCDGHGLCGALSHANLRHRVLGNPENLAHSVNYLLGLRLRCGVVLPSKGVHEILHSGHVHIGILWICTCVIHLCVYESEEQLGCLCQQFPLYTSQWYVLITISSNRCFYCSNAW
jgi:hypothetical protein